MKDLKSIKQARAAALDAAQAVVDTVVAEGRSFTADELKKYDAHMAEAEGLRETIERAERSYNLAGSTAPTAQPAANPTGFRSLGEQLQAVCRSMTPGNAVDPRLVEMRAPTGAGELVGADGGFLVGQDWSAELSKKAFSEGQILSRIGRRIPVGATSNGIRRPYLKEDSRVAGSRYGGIRTYRRAEAATATATKPAMGEFKLELESGMAVVYVTDELMQDAPQLEAEVRQLLPKAIAFHMEDEIINGNGVGKCLGILNAPSLVSVAKETGQAAATLVSENVMKMDARVWAGSAANYDWFINQDIKPQLYQLQMAIGTSGVPLYMPPNGLAAAPYGTLFGRPVIPIEHCPTLGTVGDIIAADFSQYLIIEKGGIQAATSIHVQFLYAEQVLRFMWRNNGSPVPEWSTSALTPAKGTATTSPFVVLDTRA